MQKGMQQGMQNGIREGLLEGIELAIKLKFENDVDCDKAMSLIRGIKDANRLKALKDDIKTAESVSELISRINT